MSSETKETKQGVPPAKYTVGVKIPNKTFEGKEMNPVHVTVCFVGECDAARLEKIRAGMDRLSPFLPFAFKFGAADKFGENRDVPVRLCAMEDKKAAEAVQAFYEAFGVQEPNMSFHPKTPNFHVTRKNLGDELDSLTTVQAGPIFLKRLGQFDPEYFVGPERKFTMTCISCHPPDPRLEALRKIYEDDEAYAVLRADNQVWLGRLVLVLKAHKSPAAAWGDAKYMETARRNIHGLGMALVKAFGATSINMAQLGNLTLGHDGKVTTDDRYEHCHFHLIPRYFDGAPVFLSREWPDPQIGKALNLDPAAGLPKVPVKEDEIVAIVKRIRECMPKD